uniref:Uncharacterized protein n=1 Tax=Anopheles atroparvus TaxID=41427 RepID=A0A182J6Q5_ANOAO
MDVGPSLSTPRTFCTGLDRNALACWHSGVSLSLCIAMLRRLGGHGVVCLGRVQRSVSRSTFRLAGRGSRRGPEEVLYALDDVLDGVGRLGLGLAGVGGRSVEHRADGVLHLLDDVGPRGGGLGLGGGVRGVRVDEVLHVLDELLDEIGGGGGRCWGGGGSRLVLGDLGVFSGGGWRSGGRSGAVQHVAEWRAGDEVVHRLDDLLEQVGAGGGAARLLAHLVAAQGLVGLRLDLLHRHEILRDRDGLQRSDRLLDGLDWRLLLLDELRHLRHDDGGLDGGCCFLLDDGHHLFGVLLLLLVLGHDDGGGLVDGFDWGGLAQRLNRGDYLLLDGLLNCHRVYGDDGDGFLDGSDGRKITQRLDRSDHLLLHDGGLLFGDNRDLDRFRLDNGRNGTKGLDGGDGSNDGGGFLSHDGLLLSDDGGNNRRDLNGQHGLELRDGFLRLLRLLHGFDDDGHGLGYLHHRLDGLKRLYRCDDGVLGGGNLSFGGDHGGGLFGLLQDHFRHGTTASATGSSGLAATTGSSASTTTGEALRSDSTGSTMVSFTGSAVSTTATTTGSATSATGSTLRSDSTADTCSSAAATTAAGACSSLAATTAATGSSAATGTATFSWAGAACSGCFSSSTASSTACTTSATGSVSSATASASTNTATGSAASTTSAALLSLSTGATSFSSTATTGLSASTGTSTATGTSGTAATSTAPSSRPVRVNEALSAPPKAHASTAQTSNSCRIV